MQNNEVAKNSGADAQASSQNDALAIWREKVASGEVQVERKTPKEKHALNPKSLRHSVNFMCYQCMGGCKGDNAIKDIKHCTSTGCALWHVRPYQPESTAQN